MHIVCIIRFFESKAYISYIPSECKLLKIKGYFCFYLLLYAQHLEE